MTLSPAFLDELRSRTTLSTVISPSVKLLRAGRELTALNFAQRGPFRQEPALDVPPIPDLAVAVRAYSEAPDESHTAGVALTSLVRARNRAIWALKEAARELA